ncbi:3D domain-containing protein [Caulobacter sp. NIBR2454]|uniref:3D domain-containing protein n=1 Tax=Caulobacter sp. NIBR2454 TaxID=3015996 RepID=UPI0022B72558|nr:3D domain-containing protein [Caulobacter sp. NIBR2454]
MRRLVGLLAALAVAAGFTTAAHAQNAQTSGSDPLGDVIINALSAITPGLADFKLKATLYHAGARGVGALDSLGCKVVAMRTAAIDRNLIPRRTVLFIKETVGLPMPDGGVHDGYWYASDVGGAIKGERIDLFTGSGRGSMSPMMPLNLSKLTVTKAGQFKGCPPK